MSEGSGTRLIGGTPFLRVGAGQPLVFQPGLTTHHHPPQGMDLRFQRGPCARLARDREVWWLNRRTRNPGAMSLDPSGTPRNTGHTNACAKRSVTPRAAASAAPPADRILAVRCAVDAHNNVLAGHADHHQPLIPHRTTPSPQPVPSSHRAKGTSVPVIPGP